MKHSGFPRETTVLLSKSSQKGGSLNLSGERFTDEPGKRSLCHHMSVTAGKSLELVQHVTSVAVGCESTGFCLAHVSPHDVQPPKLRLRMSIQEAIQHGGGYHLQGKLQETPEKEELRRTHGIVSTWMSQPW